MDTFRNDVKSELEKPVDSDVIYRVQVGAYKSKENAQSMLDKLKKAGFDAFIKVD